MWSRLRSLVRNLVGRRRFEDGLSEELRFHLAEFTAELVRSGVAPGEAARRARLAFGHPDNVRRDCREASGLRLLDQLQQDARYALRMLRKSPAFTATALATLAICLGANLAIFAVVDGVLLRPLPFPDADRLVRIFNTYPRAGVPDDGISLTNYYERRGRVPAFTSLSIYREGAATVGEPGATEREPVLWVSPEFFRTLGTPPVLGRSFSEGETAYGADAVAIVTDGYWRGALGGDRRVLGRRVRVDGVEKTIVGVLAPDFSLLSSPARLMLPLASDASRRGPDQRHWGSAGQMVARLAPGVTLSEAQAQIDAHNAAMETTGREARAMAAAGFRSLVVPLRADHVAAIRPTLVLVQGGALVLLLIGIVNLVNLLLIRATGRVRELAVRVAIGADRRHVVGEVLVETTLLTMAGGALGLGVGAAGVSLLTRLGADHLPLGSHIVLGWRVAAVEVAGAFVTGIVVGLPVAWYNLRGHAASALRVRGATTGRTIQLLRHAFLVTQVALAFVLLAGAGLLAVSLGHVMAVSPGFRPAHVVTARIALPDAFYRNGLARLVFTERVLEGLRRQPGIVSAGIATNVPLSGRDTKSAATIKGHVLRPGDLPHGIYSYGVGGDYFPAMGFTLLEGRFLDGSDPRRTERACVVDSDFARRNFDDRSPLGARVFMGAGDGPDAEAFTIVGVVAPVRQSELTDRSAQGAVFYPYPHFENDDVFVVVRSSASEDAAAAVLRRVVRDLDGNVPVADVRSMTGRIDDSLLVRRSPALLASLFAAVAVLLTAIGTYGVISYAVAQRRREIGLRLALGATPRQVLRQFVGLAGRLLAAGTAAGLTGAWLAGRAMRALLYDVPALHPATLAVAGLVLGVACLAACLLPSGRAARIAPAAVLTDE